jgi:hypothetical protein
MLHNITFSPTRISNQIKNATTLLFPSCPSPNKQKKRKGRKKETALKEKDTMRECNTPSDIV